MKTKIPLQQDVTVLAATHKQARQFDWSVSKPVRKVLSDVLVQISSLFKKDAKTVAVDPGSANKTTEADEWSQPVAELVPTTDEKLDEQIPQNDLDEALKNENVKVISADGMYVGNVERVFIESTFDQITHLLISKEMPDRERKLIPIKWVQVMGENTVHLHVTQDLVEELADASIIW